MVTERRGLHPNNGEPPKPPISQRQAQALYHKVLQQMVLGTKTAIGGGGFEPFADMLKVRVLEVRAATGDGVVGPMSSLEEEAFRVWARKTYDAVLSLNHLVGGKLSMRFSLDDNGGAVVDARRVGPGA